MLEDRRSADEGFRREIAERLKALEITVEILRVDSHRYMEEVKKDIVAVKMGNMDLHYSIYGGPKTNDVGLQEKLRKARWIERAVFTGIVAFIVFLGNLIKPLYEKTVVDWAFNSPSEKWMRDSQRPKVTHKTYVIKRQPVADDEP